MYVEDVADFVKMSLDKPLLGALTININGITADVKKIISIIKKNIPKSNIGFDINPLSVVDEILGEEPSKYFENFKYTSLESGIKKTIDFYWISESKKKYAY